MTAYSGHQQQLCTTALIRMDCERKTSEPGAKMLTEKMQENEKKKNTRNKREQMKKKNKNKSKRQTHATTRSKQQRKKNAHEPHTAHSCDNH